MRTNSIQSHANFSSSSAAPDAAASTPPFSKAGGIENHSLNRLPRRAGDHGSRMLYTLAASGDCPSPGTMFRHSAAAAVSVPVGIIRGAVNIAMIPVTTVIGAVGGCFAGAGAASANAVIAVDSNSVAVSCLAGTAGAVGGGVAGAALGAVAGSLGELVDTPRVAFGDESLSRGVYRAISRS